MCRSQEKNFTRRYCCPLIASEAYQPCSLLMNAILSVDEPNLYTYRPRGPVAHWPTVDRRRPETRRPLFTNPVRSTQHLQISNRLRHPNVIRISQQTDDEAVHPDDFFYITKHNIYKIFTKTQRRLRRVFDDSNGAVVARLHVVVVMSDDAHRPTTPRRPLRLRRRRRHRRPLLQCGDAVIERIHLRTQRLTPPAVAAAAHSRG
jgi:hypothetical protein